MTKAKYIRFTFPEKTITTCSDDIGEDNLNLVKTAMIEEIRNTTIADIKVEKTNMI